jgi:hypothetical protein
MSAVKHGARAGAAAFLLGLSLTASPAIAAADESDASAAADASAASSAPEKPPSATRASRGAAARVTTAGPTGVARSSAARPGAAVQPAPNAAQSARDDSQIPAQIQARQRQQTPQARQNRRTIAAAAEPLATAASAVSAPITAAPRSISLRPGNSKTGAPSAPEPSVAAAVLPANPERAATGPSHPAPVALAVMSAAPGTAAATVADLFSGLLAPIREIFEGALLLVRRTFFNQAPTVGPIQLTGQGEGPITGTLGAADPEGDAMVYSITKAPRYGSAVVNADGSYTYTPGPGFAGSDSFIAAATDTGFHINLLDPFRAASTSGNVAVRQGALADRVQFQFIYGAGSQFWSSAARSSLEYVATTLASTLVVTSPVILTYDVTGEFSPFSSTLASAGSDLISADPGFLQTVAQNKILAGIDANGSAADGTISWNFGPGWAFGDTVAGNQYDFQSTAMHELIHTLGFLTYVDQAGSNTGRSWTVFDSYLVTSNGTAVIGGGYTWNTAYNPNLTGGNGGLYFGGSNAVAAYGGLIPLYTPSSWDAGSSLSHLNDATFAGANRKLMNSRVSLGPGIRVISPLEIAILQDLGYTVVPGPGAAAWMFVGLVFVRRRPRRPAR